MFQPDPTLLAALSASLELALNRALALDPGSLQRLAALGELAIGLELQPVDAKLSIRLDAGFLRITTLDTPTDITLAGTPLSLGRLLFEGPSTDLGIHPGVQISGNPEQVNALAAIVRDLEIDWEAALADILGDIPAHFLARRWRRLQQWQKHAHQSLAMTLEDYLKEESDWLPHREQLNDYMESVDRVQQATEQLEARIMQLQAHIDKTQT